MSDMHPTPTIPSERAQGKKAEPARHPHICLLLLGPTGAGKSSFIAETTGHNISVGHGLDSCTADCSEYEFEESGTRFTLIDTPGFNDTTRDDMEILEAIAKYLNKRQLPPVSGVIYTHRITDKRVTGSSRLNLEITKALCGEKFYPHIVLLTTMWNNIANETVAADCHKRVAELSASYAHWADLISKGCRHMRFMGNRESGIDVLLYLRSLPPAPPTELQLQLQAGIDIEDTMAGVIVLEERRRRERQRLEELQEIKDEVEQRLRAEHASPAAEGIRQTNAFGVPGLVRAVFELLRRAWINLIYGSR